MRIEYKIIINTCASRENAFDSVMNYFSKFKHDDFINLGNKHTFKIHLEGIEYEATAFIDFSFGELLIEVR